MLATSYGPGIDPTGLLLSEKLDGVRAIWTGQELFTRNGRAIKAPQSLLSQLPANVTLDGELWIERGRFQELAGIVGSTYADESTWSSVHFAVFDAPETSGNYFKRLEVVTQAVQGIVFHLGQIAPKTRCFALDQVPCLGRRDLKERFRSIVKAGGEGVILRNPSAPYESRRSLSLLKLKRFESDEALVIGHKAGQGRLQGLLGSLLLLWQGRHISLGSGIPSSLRISPPPLGTRVSFSFEGLTTSGLPRSACFLTLRDYE